LSFLSACPPKKMGTQDDGVEEGEN